MSIVSPVRTIIVLSLLTRILTSSCLILLPLILPSFDSSSTLLISNPYLQSFLRWDTVYFLQIAQRGYKYEQELAFMPGLPGILRLGGFLSKLIRGSVGVNGDLMNEEDMMIFAILISWSAGICATLALYKLTLVLTSKQKFSLLTSILFLIPPSPTTLNSIPYTEPFSALFTFLGMYFHIKNRNVLAAIIWSLGTLFKAQGIILGVGFFGWKFILMSGKRQGLFRLKILPRRLISFTLLSAISIAPFVLFQFWTYSQFCSQDLRRPWCHQGFGSSYGWIQSEYWDVGPFKYWTLQQLPNFILASPVLLISFATSYTYYIHNIQYVISSTLPFIPSSFLPSTSTLTKKPSPRPFLSTKLLPFMHLHSALTILLFISSHVQIILRVCATNPVIFWYAADLISSTSTVDGKESKAAEKRRKWGKRWIGYCLIWGSVSILLWSGFYPPA